MASVYAPSSIHTKTTLSRKYEVDTSAMSRMGQQFVTNQGKDTKNLSSLLQLLSLDVGRFDFPYPWVNSVRLVVFPVLLLLTALGLDLITLPDSANSVIRTLYNIFYYIVAFIPDGTSFSVAIAVYISFIILYIALIIFLVYLMNIYKNNGCCTNMQLTIYVALSRIILPIFQAFLSQTFSHSLRKYLVSSDPNDIIACVLMIPLLAIQFIYVFIACSVYNATPIIRKNDSTQLWYSHSRLDWEINIIIFIQILLQTLLDLIKKPISCIVFCVLISFLALSFAVIIFDSLPYVTPNSNAIVLSAALSAPFLSSMPIFAYYTADYLVYALLAVIVILIIMFIAGRFIINARLKAIYYRFNILHDEEEDQDEVDDLDPLSLAYNQPHTFQKANFAKLGITNEKTISLYMRVGFLLNQQEVENQSYIKWAIDQNSKSDVVLSACQISFSLQNNIQMLNTLEQFCHKLGSAPFNYKSFIILFNNLRQELLTMHNTPFLEAVNLAKKAKHILNLTISEFWGAVLKQKIEPLTRIVPQISLNTEITDTHFQRLMRNYSKVSTVFHEGVLFYHKSVGDHHKTMECQSRYNRTRNQGQIDGDSESETSGTMTTETGKSYDGIEADFMERMEPWIAAQDVIQNLSTPPLKWLYLLMISTLIICFILPIIMLAVSLKDVSDFQDLLSPVQTLGDLQHAISRIPQLVRRWQLLVLNEVRYPPTAIFGPPVRKQLEFLNLSEIVPSIRKYLDVIDTGINTFLSLCKPNTYFYDICIDTSHLINVGGSISNSSIYDMLTSFKTSTNNIVSSSTFNPATANESQDVRFLFQNFDELYQSLSDALTVLGGEIQQKSIFFYDLSTIWFILIWTVPVVIITILTIIAVVSVKKELTFVLKLFFQVAKNEISNLRWSMVQKKSKPFKSKDKNNHVSSEQLSTSSQQSELTMAKNESMADSFATTPLKSTGLFGSFLQCLIFYVLFTCVMTSIGIIVFSLAMMQIIEMSTSSVNAIEVSSSALASYIWTQEIFTAVPILYNLTAMKEKSQTYITNFRKMFDSFLFGSNSSMGEPALLLGDDVIKAYVTSKTVAYTKPSAIPPCYGFLHEVYFSLSCEAQMRLLDEATSYVTTDRINFTFADDFVYHYEHLLFSHLDGFLFDGKLLFAQKTEELNNTRVDLILLVFIIMFVFQFVFYFTILLISFKKLKNNIYTPRRMFQLINPDALLKSQTILKWLSGVISSTSSTRHHLMDSQQNSKAQQADFVIQHSKCGLILADINYRIDKINQAIMTIFKVKEEDLIQLSFIDFFSKYLIEKNKDQIVLTIQKEVRKMIRGNSMTNKFSINSSIIDQNSQLMYISIFIEGHNDDDEIPENGEFMPPVKSFSIVINDRTTEHFQEALVESEKKKSENLIDSLMPPSIAKRLNDGETDISFEVQKASIIFASVHNMNDVIANLSAIQCMGFLNKLFSGYDAELHNFPAITKLKTIGNIYMVAGGLFTDSSVNSAQVCVDYSLKMLEIAHEVAEDLNLPFQLKIGVNTGGPINCGILGRTRPVFDIIGDSVNVASRMYSSGLPGCIQVPESTYEDIKFLKYNIKERGEIQIKGKGLRKTYIINPSE